MMLALFARLVTLQVSAPVCEAVTDAAWERCGGRALEGRVGGTDARAVRACFQASVPSACWPVLCASWQGTDYDCGGDR